MLDKGKEVAWRPGMLSPDRHARERLLLHPDWCFVIPQASMVESHLMRSQHGYSLAIW